MCGCVANADHAMGLADELSHRVDGLPIDRVAVPPEEIG
jgi:hypothetical protein